MLRKCCITFKQLEPTWAFLFAKLNKDQLQRSELKCIFCLSEDSRVANKGWFLKESGDFESQQDSRNLNSAGHFKNFIVTCFSNCGWSGNSYKIWHLKTWLQHGFSFKNKDSFWMKCNNSNIGITSTLRNTLKYKVLVMRIDISVSPLTFFHSSEYRAAINIQYSQKSPNLLHSTTKRQCFRTKGKGACAHRACACYETALCSLPATSLPSAAQAQSSGKKAEGWQKICTAFPVVQTTGPER